MTNESDVWSSYVLNTRNDARDNTRIPYRVVGDIVSAAKCDRPIWSTRPQRMRRPPNAAQHNGLAYERAIASAIRANTSALHCVTHGQWWRFTDVSGTHWCQTDILIEPGMRAKPIVIEAKLRWSLAAEQQLTELYEPVVGAALGWLTPKIVLVCAAITRETPQSAICETLAQALGSIERVPVLHVARIGGSRGLAQSALDALVLP